MYPEYEKDKAEYDELLAEYDELFKLGKLASADAIKNKIESRLAGDKFMTVEQKQFINSFSPTEKQLWQAYQATSIYPNSGKIKKRNLRQTKNEVYEYILYTVHKVENLDDFLKKCKAMGLVDFEQIDTKSNFYYPVEFKG